MVDFKLPELGENIVGGTAVKVLVKVGDAVKKDQSLMELETDKATIEVPSSVAGKITEVLVREGQEVRVGQVIVKIEEGAAGAAPSSSAPSKPAEAPKQAAQPEAPKTAPSAPKSQPTSTPVAQPSKSAIDVPAAPTVRRFAREVGVDVGQVPGSGPGGRISKEDVKAYVKTLLTSGRAGGGGTVAASRPLPDFNKFGTTNRQAMNNIRKKTAEHLTFCWQTIPHVTQFDKTDLTELEKLRKSYSTPERKLTITPFILKIMAAAFKHFPKFNSSVDMTTHEIIMKDYCHIGVAVNTDNGLLVPVIRDVNKKSLLEVADEVGQAAERARNKKSSLEELQGGCISLTNLGGIGGTFFTPIVNWPEVAILGISRAQWEPSFVGGEISSPRLMLPLSLSYDHRVIDGVDGARFIRWVAEAIEHPSLISMDKS